MPETSGKLLNMLATDKTDYESVKSFGALKEGASLNRAEVLFMRIDPVKKLKEIEETYGKVKNIGSKDKQSVVEKKLKDYISIEEFAKVKLKTGKILSAEKHPNADKLYVLKVDTGEKIRTIVSGIAEYFTLEELEGRQVVVAANLKPAKLRGVESDGMLLMAQDGDKLAIIRANDDTTAGSNIR